MSKSSKEASGFAAIMNSLKMNADKFSVSAFYYLNIIFTSTISTMPSYTNAQYWNSGRGYIMLNQLHGNCYQFKHILKGKTWHDNYACTITPVAQVIFSFLWICTNVSLMVNVTIKLLTSQIRLHKAYCFAAKNFVSYISLLDWLQLICNMSVEDSQLRIPCMSALGISLSCPCGVKTMRA